MVSSLKLEKLEKKNSDLYCRHEKKERKKEKILLHTRSASLWCLCLLPLPFHISIL